MKTHKVPFDIYIPATVNRAAVKVDTITIEVIGATVEDGMVTPASMTLIEKTQARYMGLLIGEDIVALREKLGVTQDQLSDALGCGKKSISRWENGREFPTQLVNSLLRLLEEDKISITDLRSVRQPRTASCEKIIHFIGSRRSAPRTYDLKAGWKRSSATVTEPLAM